MTTPQPVCPDCGAELEVLKACGARDYFCPRCNELKSRSRVEAAASRQAEPPPVG
ncbi:YfgJ family double zinc ribbon protein [Chitinibacteraceae bacterium HSL-7]